MLIYDLCMYIICIYIYIHMFCPCIQPPFTPPKKKGGFTRLSFQGEVNAELWDAPKRKRKNHRLRMGYGTVLQGGVQKRRKVGWKSHTLKDEVNG